MKLIKLISLFLFINILFFSFSGCSKDDPAPATSGNVVFWNYSGDGLGDVTVTINGTSQTITKDWTSTTGPDCGTSGMANFTLPAGTYNYTAKEITGTAPLVSGSGSLKLTAGGCLKFRLYL